MRWMSSSSLSDDLHRHPQSNRPENCRDTSVPPHRRRYMPGTDTQYPLRKRRDWCKKYESSCRSSRRQRPPWTPRKAPVLPNYPDEYPRWAGPVGPIAPSLSAFRCFGLGNGVVVAPVFRIILQRTQPFESFFIQRLPIWQSSS